MKVWNVEDGFILDEQAPEWATKAAWRICKSPQGDVLVRAWVDKDNTKYKYLRGYSGFNDHWTTLNDDFFCPAWINPARVFATSEEQEPTAMVCHDQFGFMTEEFKRYSQADWDRFRNEAKNIIRAAISSGVSPIAMQELLKVAIDCGSTLARAEMKVESHTAKL